MSSIDTPELDNSDTKECRSSRCPCLRVQSGRRDDSAERSASVGRVQFGTDLGREHEIQILPSTARPDPHLHLLSPMKAKCLDTSIRKFERPPRLPRLGVTAGPHRMPKLDGWRITIEVQMAPSQSA
jgi:hypothetical protein